MNNNEQMNLQKNRNTAKTKMNSISNFNFQNYTNTKSQIKRKTCKEKLLLENLNEPNINNIKNMFQFKKTEFPIQLNHLNHNNGGRNQVINFSQNQAFTYTNIDNHKIKTDGNEQNLEKKNLNKTNYMQFCKGKNTKNFKCKKFIKNLSLDMKLDDDIKPLQVKNHNTAKNKSNKICIFYEKEKEKDKNNLYKSSVKLLGKTKKIYSLSNLTTSEKRNEKSNEKGFCKTIQNFFDKKNNNNMIDLNKTKNEYSHSTYNSKRVKNVFIKKTTLPKKFVNNKDLKLNIDNNVFKKTICYRRTKTEGKIDVKKKINKFEDNKNININHVDDLTNLINDNIQKSKKIFTNIIYNDNKNIIIQNNFINNSKSHESNDTKHDDKNKKKLQYTKRIH